MLTIITFWHYCRFFTSKLKRLKFLITILLTVFLAGSSSAADLTDGKGKNKPKTELEKKKDNDKSNTVGETDPKKETKNKKLIPVDSDIITEDASDSTYNSMNKYNFIFYFIYKYKYNSEAESLRKFLR